MGCSCPPPHLRACQGELPQARQARQHRGVLVAHPAAPAQVQRFQLQQPVQRRQVAAGRGQAGSGSWKGVGARLLGQSWAGTSWMQSMECRRKGAHLIWRHVCRLRRRRRVRPASQRRPADVSCSQPASDSSSRPARAARRGHNMDPRAHALAVERRRGHNTQPSALTPQRSNSQALHVAERSSHPAGPPCPHPTAPHRSRGRGGRGAAARPERPAPRP